MLTVVTTGRLGRYELITQIGQGGMAEVQLALQRGPAGFEKLVVVKLVHDHLATQTSFVEMLLEEARMAALVKHPNVVDIYDLGEAEGRYFIAMEYLEGEPLLAVLRAGREGNRLDVMSTGRLIADTAEGLDAAHELRTLAGDTIELVHHDVSLGNIVVLYNGQVKLVDFGVAKATQSAGPRVRVQGKFSYMAPEKLRGDAGDRRSDIWSLGCVLWEALTLRRLFRGGNDEETARVVLETEIQTPSSINGDVPAVFDPIVMKALERDPAKRYATAKEMAAAIEDVLREHKYGGRNDQIAKYMQRTFKEHIDARRALLQEVSSKGRASQEMIEAAFASPIAQGSPTNDLSGRHRFSRNTFSPLPVHGSSPGEHAMIAQPSPGLLASVPRPKLIAGLVIGIAIVGIAIVAGLATGSGKAPPPRAKPVAAVEPTAVIDAAPVEPHAVSDAAPADEGSASPPVAPPVAPPADPPPRDSSPDTARPRGNPQELFKTGMKQYVKGELGPAVASFRKALQINPRFGAAWRALGLANEKLGEWGQAKAAFQKYLQVSPKAADAAQIRERIKNL